MDRANAASLLLLLLGVGTTWSLLLLRGDPNALDMEVCMGCICEATTNCNLTIGCTRGLCGPFLVSRIYWDEAGRPVLPGDHPSNRGAYHRCVTEPYCAATAVRRYLGKYAQDCDKNGRVDCDDYAKIHYMGGRQCRANMQHLGYYKVFRECRNSIQQLNG
ncbi:invertebrate-type lysozyme 6-like [Periplaneta americana]|uniref:invertebrate-type lysozyme 6-like n=1 Tax=Periplaneta americana TaxID=6978 RepID=UPI0037E717CB